MMFKGNYIYTCGLSTGSLESKAELDMNEKMGVVHEWTSKGMSFLRVKSKYI